MEGNFPGGNFPWGQFSEQGCNFQGGNFPGGIFPRTKMFSRNSHACRLPNVFSFVKK